MTQICAVIFDLGGVLVGVDMSRGLWARWKDFFWEGVEISAANLLKQELITRYCIGALSPQEFHQEVCDRSGHTIDFEEFAYSWCDVFFPMDEMTQLFEEISQVIPVGLLSDTDPLHWDYICRHYPRVKRIAKPTLSFQIGVLKPHPKSYQSAARNLGVPKENCLFIDDRIENVIGAQQVGMDGIQFRDATELREHLIKRNLLD